MRYAKAIGAALGAISAWGMTAAAKDGIDIAELFGLLGVLGTALVVYAVPNRKPTRRRADG